MIRIIVAVDKDGGMGKDNKIPWDVPEDFKFFMTQTKNSMCLMGRNTYEELVELKKERLQEKYDSNVPVLSNRISVVLSNTLDPLSHFDCMIVNDSPPDKLLEYWIANDNSVPVYVLGGPAIFKQVLHLVDEIVITRIPDRFGCTEFFPFVEIVKKDFMVEKVDILHTERYGPIEIATYTPHEEIKL